MRSTGIRQRILRSGWAAALEIPVCCESREWPLHGSAMLCAAAETTIIARFRNETAITRQERISENRRWSRDVKRFGKTAGFGQMIPVHRRGTPPATLHRMILTLGLLAVLVSGFAVMFAGLRNAPEGYQEAGEFHVLWRNNRPEVSNIVCIWTGQRIESAISLPGQLAA